MERIMKMAVLSIAAAVMVMGVGTAQAALLSYTITGDVYVGNESGANAFGLSAGDNITATGIFDDSPLSGGTGTVSFGSGSGNTMTIYVGTETFQASDDTGYGGGSYPQLVFSGFALDEFNFVATSPETFNSNFLFFDDLGGAYGDLFGEWRTSVPTAAVPEPMSAALVSSVLIGLLAIRVRREKA